MSTFFRYLKKWWVITGIILVALIIFAVVAAANKNQTVYSYVTVHPTTVSAGVSVTGNVTSSDTVDLAFVKSGKIAAVNNDVGDRVEPNDTIVALDNADLQAQYAQAQAQVKVQQAKLNELIKGTRPEQLQITQAKLAGAQSDFSRAQIGLLSALQNAYSSTDDAIHNKADEFFIDGRTSNPHLAFAQTVTTATSIESGRVQVEYKLNDMAGLLTAASTSSDLPALSTQIKQDIAEAKLFLDNAALAVNALTATSYLPQTTVTEWKTDLAAARTEVNSALTAILTADSTYADTQSALSVAEGQYSLDQAGNVSDDIQAQQAQVDSAQATVASIAAQLAQTYIRAPISGIVTKQDAKVGEIAPVGTPLVSIISDTKFQIEANIAEADIAKVALGQKASVTLDAYGPDINFNATVIKIDPAETIVDGVPTYKTTFQFDMPDDRIKSGMTANIDIQGDSHANVLAVPERAVIDHNGTKYVRVKNTSNTKNTVEEVPVTTGLRGEDGKIEITSGLQDGDTVAITTVNS